MAGLSSTARLNAFSDALRFPRSSSIAPRLEYVAPRPGFDSIACSSSATAPSRFFRPASAFASRICASTFFASTSRAFSARAFASSKRRATSSRLPALTCTAAAGSVSAARTYSVYRFSEVALADVRFRELHSDVPGARLLLNGVPVLDDGFGSLPAVAKASPLFVELEHRGVRDLGNTPRPDTTTRNQAPEQAGDHRNGERQSSAGAEEQDIVRSAQGAPESKW